MAFNYTNFLEVDADVEADFVFTDRAGTVETFGSGLYTRNTAGKWCLETNGSTTSSGTGPSANPAGRSAYIYDETSSPSASSTWAMRRAISFNSLTQAITLNLIYNLNATVTGNVLIEYATVASPNETTDWTTLETIPCTLTDSWISDSFDFSGIFTATLWIRVRLDLPSDFTSDIGFSTWNEVGLDIADYEQEGFQFREDDGTNIGSQDVDAGIPEDTNIRLRILNDVTGDPPTTQATIQYRRVGDPDSEWRNINNP